jgi:cell volume regulation protein A
VSDPVTVFMLVVAGLLVVGTVGELVFRRTGVPSVVWLVALGILVRVAGIVPPAVITGLAPFFAALALVIVLFDAGTNLTGKPDEGNSASDPSRGLDPATHKRAQILAFAGFAAITTLVALFSQALHGLDILPTWSWAHAFMLGSLVGCGASEVFLPSLPGLGASDEALAVLRRESAITRALAVTGTVVCLDLLSPRIAVGGAGLAMVASFGFALAFGTAAGVLWVIALQRLSADHARNYGFTLAVMVVLYVLSESAGGAGPLSVLIFGAVLGNAGALLRVLRRGNTSTDADPGEAVRAALGGHARTIEFVRILVFAMVGLTLAPPWGPLVMGVALAFLILVSRLAVARFALHGLEQRARNIIGTSAPRGMATVALVTLPLAHAVPGAREMVALVFSAVTTSVLLFTIGSWELRRHGGAPRPIAARPPNTSFAASIAADVAASHPAMVLPAEARPLAARPAPTPAPTPAPSGAPTPTPIAAATPAPSSEAVVQALADAVALGDDPRAPTLPQSRDVLAVLPRPDLPPAPPQPAERPLFASPLIAPLAPPLAALPLAPAPIAPAYHLGPATPLPTRDPASTHATPDPPSAHAATLAPGTVPGTAIRPSTPAPHRRAPESFMHTLPQIAPPRPHDDDPLADAMARALAKRPDEVTQVRRRPTGDFEVPPPTFTPFPGSSEEDALSLLAKLGMHDDDDGDANTPPGERKDDSA